MEKTPYTKYWCFNCNKECQYKINADKDSQCLTCQSTFLEEITEDSNP